jgi:hypothetical protein
MCTQLNEAMALLLVEKHTVAPAPLYIDDYREDEDTVLISTRIPGQTLRDIFRRLSFAEREQLSQDLKEAIKQIRRIPHRRPFCVCNTLGLPLVDQRVVTGGPFRTLAEFTKHIVLRTRRRRKTQSPWTRLLRFLHGTIERSSRTRIYARRTSS